MWSASFWKSTAERTITTMAEVALPIVAAERLDKIDGWAALMVVAGAGVGAVLKALIASRVRDKGTPSLVEGGQ